MAYWQRLKTYVVRHLVDGWMFVLYTSAKVLWPDCFPGLICSTRGLMVLGFALFFMFLCFRF